jgi:hypothetical protein
VNGVQCSIRRGKLLSHKTDVAALLPGIRSSNLPGVLFTVFLAAEDKLAPNGPVVINLFYL